MNIEKFFNNKNIILLFVLLPIISVTFFLFILGVCNGIEISFPFLGKCFLGAIILYVIMTLFGYLGIPRHGPGKYNKFK